MIRFWPKNARTDWPLTCIWDWLVVAAVMFVFTFIWGTS